VLYNGVRYQTVSGVKMYWLSEIQSNELSFIYMRKEGFNENTSRGFS